MMNFKELGKFGKEFQVLQYKKVYKAKDLPVNNKPEVIFIGKSNVGKSTLLNTVLNYKINKTSKKPGCTKWIGFLELPNFNLIDLPGYGFASVSKGRKEFWKVMIDDYINKKRCSQAFILIDSRRGIQMIDSEIQSSFKHCQCDFIFTKIDESKILNEGEICTSTKSGIGIIELREILSEISKVK